MLHNAKKQYCVIGITTLLIDFLHLSTRVLLLGIKAELIKCDAEPDQKSPLKMCFSFFFFFVASPGPPWRREEEHQRRRGGGRRSGGGERRRQDPCWSENHLCSRLQGPYEQKLLWLQLLNIWWEIHRVDRCGLLNISVLPLNHSLTKFLFDKIRVEDLDHLSLNVCSFF